jgi:TolA-binding protein
MYRRMRGAGLALWLGGVAWAQTGSGPLHPPVPFAPAPAAVSPAEAAVTLGAASRAHDLGFLSTAANLYRRLLETPGADRREVTLALATVLLDSGEAAEAERLLAPLAQPPTAAWRLRTGLAALQLRKREVAQAQWDAIKADEVAEADRPWYHFFTGALFDTATPRDTKNEQRANEYYVLAEKGAATELARARFQLAAERVRVRQSGTPTREALDQAKRLFDQAQGREWGYESARQYAVMLALLNRRGEAVTFLQQNVLLGMPAQERAWRDEFHFMIGVLGDRTRTGAGRNALMQLAANGSKVQRQRQALQLLADASESEPERGHFRTELSRWLAATPPHPLRESLLYFRAKLALTERDYAAAESHADQLLKEYPGSALRVHAFGLLAQSAWEQQRYRRAASNARSARDVLSAAGAAASQGAARGEFGLLEAEAWFRLGEYRDAADAYAAVLRERPPGLSPERVSALIFQRVLAEIRAGSAAAVAVLDESETNPEFRVDDRWQAEWSLARSLQLQGRLEEGYARVGRLLGLQGAEGSGAGLRPELRARMAWLHAKLAFDSGRYDAALAHAAELLRAPGEFEPALRAEIVSTSVLLQAQAELNLKREEAALATLKRLRDEFPKTDAAVQSYLIESDYFAQQEKIPQAQQRLTSLIDNPDYAKDPNLPYALFQLALLSERLGQEKDLEEANRRLEQLVNLETAAKETELIFAARLKQGDVFRIRSDFPAAQRAYEYLTNGYAQRPDVVVAQLKLADCHSAQSSADPAHADTAQQIYEQLRDRVDAPVEVRVEAGYKLGVLLARRGQAARAADVWWKDVVTEFLLKAPAGRGAGELPRYWLARTLFDLGKLHEEQQRLSEARRAYALIIETKLGSAENIARDALRRLGAGE